MFLSDLLGFLAQSLRLRQGFNVSDFEGLIEVLTQQDTEQGFDLFTLHHMINRYYND